MRQHRAISVVIQRRIFAASNMGNTKRRYLHPELNMVSLVQLRQQSPTSSCPYTKNRWHSSRPVPIQINQAIVAYGDRSDWEGILKQYAVNRPYFNDINYATAMSRLAKLKPRLEDTRLQQMIIDITEDLSTVDGIHRMGIQGVSNCLHALAKLRQREALQTILKVVDTMDTAEYIVESSKPQAIANILWSSAKFGIPVPNICNFVCRDADRLANKGNARDLANIVWSLAKLGIKHTTWFSTTLDDQVYKISSSMNQQDLINCVWACATAGSANCPRLLALVAQKGPWLVDNPQDIANAVWAFATLKIKSNRLFDVLEQNAKTIVRDGHTQTVSNCAWACSVMKVGAPQLFQEIEANATRLASAANATELASIATAAVRLKHPLPQFFFAIDENAERVSNDRVGNPQALSNILWAMAKQKLFLMRLYDQTIQKDQVTYIFDSGSPQEVTIIAWALETLDSFKFTRSVYYKELLSRGDQIRSTGDAQAIATLEDILKKVQR